MKFISRGRSFIELLVVYRKMYLSYELLLTVWFWTSEHPWMVDLVLLHLPCSMDSEGYYNVTAGWCRNYNCGTRFWGLCETILGSKLRIWPRYDRSFGSGSRCIQRPILFGLCNVCEIHQLSEEMILLQVCPQKMF